MWAGAGGWEKGPDKRAETEDGGRIPIPGQLPTQPGRLWAGRKQPPEARGTRQTRVPGNEPYPEPFFLAHPVTLAGHWPPPILSAPSKRTDSWAGVQQMALHRGGTRSVLKPSGTRPGLSPPVPEQGDRAGFQGPCSVGLRRSSDWGLAQRRYLINVF